MCFLLNMSCRNLLVSFWMSIPGFFSIFCLSVSNILVLYMAAIAAALSSLSCLLASSCRSCMRLSSDLIFLCGQRGMPNSLHFLFKTVSPTFKLLEASVIGTSKYFARSFSAMLATRWVGARWIYLFSSFSSLDALLFLPFTPALLGRSTVVFLQHNIDESSEASFFELCGAWLHSIDWKTAMPAILRLDF